MSEAASPAASDASRPDRYGVMGYPVSHSRSPVIHKLFAEQTGQAMTYELLEVEPARLEGTIRKFQASGGRGLNVTVPHKSEVVRLVDELSDRAATAGAVNTLVIHDDHIRGENTDGLGLVRDLGVNLGYQIAGTRILILGAGGATRGVVGPLLEHKPGSLTIANRTLSKAQALAAHFGNLGNVQACRFDDVGGDGAYDLVVNATSAGLKGATPPFPAAAVADAGLCYDMSYGLKTTPFVAWAAANGARRTASGWGMLIEQAAASFHLWRGVYPDTAPVLKQLRT